MAELDEAAALRKRMRPDPGDQTTARQLPDGSFFCTVNYVYEIPVSTSSEHYRNYCEARFVLDMPDRESRRAYMAKIAAIRSKGQPKGSFEKIKSDMENAVTAEWEWRRKQRGEQQAA